MKNLHTFFVMIFSLIAITGCASYSMNDSSTAKKSYESQADVERFIIKSASVDIEVSHPLIIGDEIKAIIERESGYIDYTNNKDEKSVNITARVPQARLESVVDEISTKGKLISKSINAKDVTEEMIDINARLKNLHVLRDRFRILLSKAEKVSEVLEIERELSRIQSDIDSIEGRMKSLKNQVAYSRVDISVDRNTTYGPLGYLFNGVYWGIKKLFVIQ